MIHLMSRRSIATQPTSLSHVQESCQRLALAGMNMAHKLHTTNYCFFVVVVFFVLLAGQGWGDMMTEGAPMCKCLKMRNYKVGIPLRAEPALSFSSGLGRCPYTSCEGVASSCTVCTAAAATPLAFSMIGAACKSSTFPSSLL